MTELDPVAAFIYVLLRDELPAGRVARIVEDLETRRHVGAARLQASRGSLAAFASELADRLTGAGETTMMDANAVREAAGDHATTELELQHERQGDPFYP